MDSIIELHNRLERIEQLLLGSKTVMTVDEAVIYTGLSKSYLYKLTSAGVIPHYKPNGKQIYFKKEEIDTWLLRNRVRSSSEIEALAINAVVCGK
ncbi:MAG TPA: helix-turn-helix domain-containing protein [Roseivirga sp.]